MSGITGRFAEAVMWQAMRQVARQLDVSADDAILLRLTNNAVFALPAAGLVIRITRSLALAERVHKVANLGAWFERVGAPTIRLDHRIDQPVRAGRLLATVWRYLPPRPPAPTGSDLGQVLREFHALPPPPFALPRWDPVGDARTRLADAEALADHEREFLARWCDRLETRVASLRNHSDWRLIHGDAHVGNLLRESATRVVLCDFDSTCRGPWQVDLVSVAVGEIRFGRVDAHQVMATAYGYDVTRDPDWPLFREVRELKLVVSAVPLLASTPGVAAQFRVRLNSIMDGDENARWTPYADVSRPSGGDHRQ